MPSNNHPSIMAANHLKTVAIRLGILLTIFVSGTAFGIGLQFVVGCPK